MPDETHLSEKFYEDFAAITTQLQDELTGHEYGTFFNHCKKKQLAKATYHLQQVEKTWNKYLDWLVNEGREKYENFDANFVIDTVATHVKVWAIFVSWRELMAQNGGPERTAKLIKQNGHKLRMAPPLPFAPINP